jgi:hypothetical protein
MRIRARNEKGRENASPASFTRLRQDAPCGTTGRNGERRPRRSPKGEAGWLFVVGTFSDYHLPEAYPLPPRTGHVK